MEIIPAIDLLKGSCVRLHQGKYSEVTQFNSNPVEQALAWQGQGARRLHLVDLDAAKTGTPVNDSVIKEIVETLNIPIQIGGGVRSIARAEELINYGVDRVIIGTIALENPDLIKNLAEDNPKKIVVGIDAKEGKVATRGWTNQSNIYATDLAKIYSDSQIAAIICTDISTDGTLKGPNLDAMREMASCSEVPVIASGGIGSISDLLSLLPLKTYGISGVIVGRALYDKKVDLQEALKVVNNADIQDSYTKDVFTA